MNKFKYSKDMFRAFKADIKTPQKLRNSWSDKSGLYKRLKDELCIHTKDNHGTECFYCKLDTERFGGKVEVEHVLDRILFEEYTFNYMNLSPICKVCNTSKITSKKMKNNDAKEKLVKKLKAKSLGYYKKDDLKILNPNLHRYEDYIKKDIIYLPINNSEVGANTIEIYKLNRFQTIEANANQSANDLIFNVVKGYLDVEGSPDQNLSNIADILLKIGNDNKYNGKRFKILKKLYSYSDLSILIENILCDSELFKCIEFDYIIILDKICENNLSELAIYFDLQNKKGNISIRYLTTFICNIYKKDSLLKLLLDKKTVDGIKLRIDLYKLMFDRNPYYETLFKEYSIAYMVSSLLINLQEKSILNDCVDIAKKYRFDRSNYIWK